MMVNIWNRIKDWFRDRNDRALTVREFNEFAREAFISGIVPTLLKADISRGNPRYKHKFSHFNRTGFRVKVLSGRPLMRDELIILGEVILNETALVRKLVVLGWDTLEIHEENMSSGLQWQLIAYLELSH